jgi:AraC family transcriptional regulator, ethanolamine operon transcriptional activator
MLDVTVDDIDLMAAYMTTWRHHYVALGHGPFRGRLHGFQTLLMQFGTAEYSQGFAIRGYTPAGTCTLRVYESSTRPIVYCGRPIDPERESAFSSSDAEYDMTYGGASSIVSLSVAQPLFDRYASAHWGDWEKTTDRLFFEDERTRTDFIALAHDVIDRTTKDPTALDDGRGPSIEADVLTAFFQAAKPGAAPSPLARRHEIAREAHAYLMEHIDRPPTLAEICAAISVNERTLLAGFLEAYGESPKAYLRNARLMNARRNLLRSGSQKTTVTEIAARWGFGHYGRFAADYRRLFGELPSQSLARSRRAAELTAAASSVSAPSEGRGANAPDLLP